MLLMILYELLVITKNKQLYKNARERFSSIVDLQTSYPNLQDPTVDFELLMFEKNMNDYMYIESSIKLPKDIEDFKKLLMEKSIDTYYDRTHKAGFDFLKTLSRIYYQNDIFPNEWRKFIA